MWLSHHYDQELRYSTSHRLLCVWPKPGKEPAPMVHSCSILAQAFFFRNPLPGILHTFDHIAGEQENY